MNNIDQIQKEIIEEFQFLQDWESKYEYIIELGKSLPPMDEQHKIDENLIKGCQSRVWLWGELLPDGKVSYIADSDAIITKGIIALLLRVFNHQTPDDIINADIYFVDKIGLKEHLSPTRANGLVAMIKHIKFFALGLKLKNSEKS
jgi:cysteine desulfuration protein SufE